MARRKASHAQRLSASEKANFGAGKICLYAELPLKKCFKKTG